MYCLFGKFAMLFIIVIFTSSASNVYIYFNKEMYTYIYEIYLTVVIFIVFQWGGREVPDMEQ